MILPCIRRRSGMCLWDTGSRWTTTISPSLPTTWHLRASTNHSVASESSQMLRRYRRWHLRRQCTSWRRQPFKVRIHADFVAIWGQDDGSLLMCISFHWECPNMIIVSILHMGKPHPQHWNNLQNFANHYLDFLYLMCLSDTVTSFQICTKWKSFKNCCLYLYISSL